MQRLKETREPQCPSVFSLFPMSFFQEPHSRGHLSRPEAQSLSPYTTSANRAKLLAKNRQTFLLQTTKLTRLARRMCRDLLQPRRAARRPYAPINANAIKAECKGRSGGASGRPGRSGQKAEQRPVFLWRFNDHRDSRPQWFGRRLDVAPGRRRGLNSEAPSKAFIFALQAPFDFLRLRKLH